LVNIAHKNLTDPDLHEPKGISTATAGQVYVADGNGSGTWEDLPEVDPDDVRAPYGLVIDYTGTTAPSQWLLCYGQAISRATYSNLFTAISTQFGAGDGSTTFNVPDYRGRVGIGQDDMGGTSANIVTIFDGDNFALAGGSEGHTLTAAECPTLTGTTSSGGAHSHNFTNGNSIIRVNLSSGTFGSGSVAALARGEQEMVISSAGSHSHTVTVNSNSATSHSNVQPTFILNKIIFTGVV
jgi:microcystin-dependent protein